MRNKLILVSVGLVISLIVFRSHKNPPPSSGYIDPAACAGCHQEIAETYRLTGMGRSFYRPRPDNKVEDYKVRNTFHHARSDRDYTMLERDGKFYQRRSQKGFDGKETNIIEEQIDFVIGSGNHSRSYLHRTAEGKLLQLPISWYAEDGGYWAMSPGYDRPAHPDFRRAVANNCVSCHNAYPSRRTADRAGEEPMFGNDLPEGIDCQRCHGPGQAHVEAARSSRATRDDVRRAIVNPARLDRDRQLETCMQCHLETTSGPLPYVIPRYDRPPFSYRPGQPFGDYFIFFDHAAGSVHDDKFEIAGAAYRLRQSACFQNSRMTCITCHNPHDIPRGNDAVQRYISICKSCHETAHSPAAANCLDCHMPKRRTDDAVHVVMTDHYIQRRKPARDLLARIEEPSDPEKTAYRGEVRLYYPAELTSSADTELYLAVAQVQQGSNLMTGVPRLQQAIEKYKPPRAEFYFELARAYSKIGDNAAAVRWQGEAIRHDSTFRAALKELANVLTATGELPRAAEALEKAIAIDASDSFALTDLGNAYLRQEKIEKAEQVLQQALALDPDIPQANNLLGLASLKRDDSAASEKYFRNAIRIQPDLAEAHNNLANLLASRRDYPQAAYHFEKAIAANPNYLDAHHSYAMALVLMDSVDKAMVELQYTVRLATDTSSPAQYEAHLALGEILARKGRLSEAREHFAIAARSPDPDVRQAAREAMR